VRVLAESLFVIADSAGFDTKLQAWRPAHRDTVRAWLLASDSSATGARGWIDEQGRVVATPKLLGFELTRTAFELAFEQWRRGRAQDASPTTRPSSDDDVLETTAIAASRPISGRRLDHLRVRLRGASLLGFDLDGDGQSASGDTLRVERATMPPRPRYDVPAGVGVYARGIDRDSALRVARALAPYVAPEPLLQSTHPEIVALAHRLAGTERDPRVVAERIARWVHDSLEKRVTVSVPSALEVLQHRSGDCNEHTQLFVALARASRIPARPIAGVAFVDGKFYYHVWPEVWLGRWVAIDPTFGQFPADASHLRFVRGGLARQTELLRLMGQLRIDVLPS
jgi:transglutaminase-like putative cysteine protease